MDSRDSTDIYLGQLREVSAAEMARITGRSPRTVIAALRRGEVPEADCSDGGRWSIPLWAIKRWQRTRTSGVRANTDEDAG